MFKHYLITALRHFARHKATTVINILCLALGLACFAISKGMVSYLDNADRYHEKASRTYVVTQRNVVNGAAPSIGSLPISGFAIGPLIQADHPELQIVARAVTSREVAVATEQQKDFAQASFVDPDFLTVFDLPFVAGDRTALKAPHSAVISDELAKKLFGDAANALGQALLLNNHETVHVGGVIAPPRQPSHLSFRSSIPGLLEFSMLVSMDAGEAILRASIADFDSPRNRLISATTFTYIVFSDNSSTTTSPLRLDLSRFSDRHLPAAVGRIELGIRPVTEIFASLGDAMIREKSGISNNTLTLIYGLALLLAACVNYANLASAQALTRLKELAMRRVVGAGSPQVLGQAFFEALLLVSVAAILTLVFLPGMSTLFSTQLGLDIRSQLFVSGAFWIWFLLTIFGVAALACAYPAWVAITIRPAHALQSLRAPTTKRRLMHFFVVAQFVVASILFIDGLVMRAQNEKMKPLRAQADDLTVVVNNSLQEAGIDVAMLENELRRQPAITAVGAIDVAPGQLARHTRGTVLASAESSAKHWLISAPIIDDQFFASMDIKLLAGRLLDRNVSDDLSSAPGNGNVVIDRKLATEYGWTNPHDAIGKSIYVASSAAKDAVGLPRTVVGVTENKMLVPMVMVGSSSTMYSLNLARASVPIVRIAKDRIAEGTQAIDATWSRLAPNIPLKRRFMDEQFETVYRQMTSIMSIVPALAILAGLIGTLGLFGIATHAMAQRRFEIGVRRSLGASVRRVLIMLLKDFSKPIAIANLVAWPLAFGYARIYTSFFSDREPVTLTPFIASLLIGFAIAWLTVFRQATNAARTNPAAVLRHE